VRAPCPLGVRVLGGVHPLDCLRKLHAWVRRVATYEMDLACRIHAPLHRKSVGGYLRIVKPPFLATASAWAQRPLVKGHVTVGIMSARTVLVQLKKPFPVALRRQPPHGHRMKEILPLVIGHAISVGPDVLLRW
jgi:hypothetical protein